MTDIFYAFKEVVCILFFAALGGCIVLSMVAIIYTVGFSVCVETKPFSAGLGVEGTYCAKRKYAGFE